MPTPEDFDLIVLQHIFLDETSGQWIDDGYTLEQTDTSNHETEKYVHVTALPDQTNGVAVYLFNAENDAQIFITGMIAAGHDLTGVGGGVANIGDFGLIIEFGSRENFSRAFPGEDITQIQVSDRRSPEKPSSFDETLIVQHTNSKLYGQHVKSSPEFQMMIGDMRENNGAAFVLVSTKKDELHSYGSMVLANIETIPGTQRTAPAFHFSKNGASGRIFRAFRNTQDEFIIALDKGVLFVPHLMADGSMGFKVNLDSE
jgi:hypothetical protein